MDDIEFNEDFVPEGGESGKGPAVTVGAGVQLFKLYRFCHEKNVTVVGGFSSTVGVAGGYIQGGGHSILSPWKGLASDHVLQYTVVTANVRASVICCLHCHSRSAPVSLTSPGNPRNRKRLPKSGSLLGSPWRRRRNLRHRHQCHPCRARQPSPDILLPRNRPPIGRRALLVYRREALRTSPSPQRSWFISLIGGVPAKPHPKPRGRYA